MLRHFGENSRDLGSAISIRARQRSGEGVMRRLSERVFLLLRPLKVCS